MKKKKLYYIIIVIFILLIAGLWFFMQQKNKLAYEKQENQASAPDEHGKTVYVEVYKATKECFIDKFEGLTGTIKGSSFEIKSNQEENLIAYRAWPGQYVKKGDLIVELDHTRTEVKLNQAKLDYQRKQSLFKLGGISQSELDQATYAVKIAEKDYQDTFIRAQKNGYIGEIIAQEGELISKHSPIALFVSAEEDFFVETSIIESKAKRIKLKQKATVNVDVLPGTDISGYVKSISPQATTNSRMVPLKIGIPQKYYKELRPGFSAVVSITVYDKNTIKVPVASLIKDKLVYVVGENKEIFLRDVKLGYATRDFVEIVSGLEHGEVIVANSYYTGLKEGVKVKYEELEEKQPGDK